MWPAIDTMSLGGPFLSRHLRSAGFTTIELMIGVVIVGILAALAIPTFKGYVYRGRVAEAVTVLNEIKTRQEAYRARFGNYAAVSGTAWGNYTPGVLPGANAVPWPSSAGWEALGLSSPGAVRFQYATIAGQPGGPGPPANTNLDGNKFWFAAKAQGDLDDDGTPFILEVYSDSRTMFNSASGQGGYE